MTSVLGLAHGFLGFLVLLGRNRRTIMALAVRDFRANYLGSYLSLAWAFIHPVVNLGLLYFVFQVGFAAGPVDDHPFAIWLVAGMVPWFFVSEALNGGTNAVLTYSYLVKKIVFMTSALPIIKIIAGLFVHLAFLGVTMGVLQAAGYSCLSTYLQLPYFVFCSLVLLVGATWLTSALAVFARDVLQVVAAGTQVLMWATPIVWPLKNLPAQWAPLMRLNPVHYIVQGYRDSLLYGVWFWERPEEAVFFWSMTLTLFVAGAVVFYRLRTHFADVL